MFSIGARSGDKSGKSRTVINIIVSYNVSVVVRFSV